MREKIIEDIGKLPTQSIRLNETSTLRTNSNDEDEVRGKSLIPLKPKA